MSAAFQKDYLVINSGLQSDILMLEKYWSLVIFKGKRRNQSCVCDYLYMIGLKYVAKYLCSLPKRLFSD